MSERRSVRHFLINPIMRGERENNTNSSGGEKKRKIEKNTKNAILDFHENFH